MYGWSGNSSIIGLFVPVNESVWEHLKLGYWSAVLLALMEYSHLRGLVRNYFAARLVGVVVLEAVVLVVYYGYTAIIERTIYQIDIASYVVGAIACQYATYHVATVWRHSSFVNKACLVVFAGMGLIFAIATYYPLRIPVIMDNNTGTYGIGSHR